MHCHIYNPAPAYSLSSPFLSPYLQTHKHSQFHCLGGIKLETFTVLGNLRRGIPVDVSHRPAAALILAQHSAGSSPSVILTQTGCFHPELCRWRALFLAAALQGRQYI